jgi:adenine-specific DNA-methyltransferase
LRQILCGGARFTEVDRILAAKERDPKADTTALEREIDRLVYELYGLTEDEIKIVEGKQ